MSFLRSASSVEDGDALDLDQEVRLGGPATTSRVFAGYGASEQLVARGGDQRPKPQCVMYVVVLIRWRRLPP
jgi:hypothetical protein